MANLAAVRDKALIADTDQKKSAKPVVNYNNSWSALFTKPETAGAQDKDEVDFIVKHFV